VRRRQGPNQEQSTFKSFFEALKPPNDETECIRESLRLALEILAPVLVQYKEEHVDVENKVHTGTQNFSETAGANPKVAPPGHVVLNTVAGEEAPKEGYVSPCRTSPGSCLNIRH
jgi:hypothetical protein